MMDSELVTMSFPLLMMGKEDFMARILRHFDLFLTVGSCEGFFTIAFQVREVFVRYKSFMSRQNYRTCSNLPENLIDKASSRDLLGTFLAKNRQNGSKVLCKTCWAKVSAKVCWTDFPKEICGAKFSC